MKTTITLSAIAATALSANAALVATNLSFENGTTGWTATSTGTGTLETADFRTANDPDNWFPDTSLGEDNTPNTTDDNTVLIIESDSGVDDTGTFAQALTGTAEAGTYTWNLSDVGVTNFADNSADGAFVRFGFSADGSTFIAGSFVDLIEGTNIASPSQNASGQFNGGVSYTATGLEPNLYIMFESFNGVGNNIANGRTAVTVGSSDLAFTAAVAIPEPSSTALLGLSGIALILRRRK
ncbi:PEP-CTERM sorting domain-containing protein [Rubritalea tangerina]|uniref:PEP-CTERM sorting domain-containing protein n=1 Tax=Rubritalea tangerina TaxID=430798 RepID=A0ABW4Z779_9BACT